MLVFFILYAGCFSLDLFLQTATTRIKYIRKIHGLQPKIKMLVLPKVKNGISESQIGCLSAYKDNYQDFEEENQVRAESVFIFDSQYHYLDFRQNVLSVLFDLNQSREHPLENKKRNGYERLWTKAFGGFDNSKIIIGFNEKDKNLPIRKNENTGQTEIFASEARTFRTLIADESVFENESIKIIVGSVKHHARRITDFQIARSVDQLNLSLDYLVRAGVWSERSEGKPVEVLVIGPEGITENDIQQKINQIIGDGVEYERLVTTHLPNEKNSSWMGGFGISATRHHHTKNFIFNARVGLDYLWGKFSQTAQQNINTENMPKLGWGITLGTGIDYKLTEKATIGLESGVRLSEFKVPQKEKPQASKSSWFFAPYVQMTCSIYPKPEYSVSVFSGCFLPRTFKVKTDGTNLSYGTKCKFDGVFGGLKISRHF